MIQRDWETKAAQRVDDNLENFLGIRDMELGETIMLSYYIYLQMPKWNYFIDVLA